MNVESKISFDSKNKNFNSYFFSKLSLNIKIFLLVSLMTLVIFFIFFFKSPNYSILYKNLSNDDEKNIILRLIYLNTPYKFSKDHSELLIPDNEFEKVRYDLLEQGLPKEKKVGFELLDSEKFGLSQFNEQVNYQRALEGELARSIQKINSIKTARVHIVLSKPSLFMHENISPSASILLEIKSGMVLDFRQINAIVHLISRSVSGLSTRNITIIDQFGKLLNNASDLYDNYIDNNQLKYSNEIENRYQQRIKNILIPFLGVNNIYAQVTAQINFDKKESSEEKYAPNYNSQHQSIRSRQNKTNIEFSKKYIDNLFSSIPDDHSKTLSNNDVGKFSSTNSSNNLSSVKQSLFSKVNKNPVKNFSIIPKSSTDRDDIINYELDHTIFHNKFYTGNVKRLSVAVIVNYIQDKSGKLVPLSREQLKGIRKLVRESIGFSKKRGDSVSIVNFKFLKPIPVKELYDVNLNRNYFFDSIFKYILVLLGIIFLFILGNKLCTKKILNNSSDKDKRIDEKTKTNNDFASVENNNDINKNFQLQQKLDNVLKFDVKKIAIILKKWMHGEKL
ncbi:MAG: flagellar basal-body MS-ring/collar protein FliF [Buchnera aphidicola (Chaetogeoica yunlongensis)]